MTPSSLADIQTHSPALRLVVFFRDGVEAHDLNRSATVTVGRSSDCDLALHHPRLSRRHFLLNLGRAPSLRDLGSVNGTTVNGMRVVPGVDVSLHCGALIGAGGLFFSLRAAEAPRGAHAPRLVVEDPAMLRLHDLLGSLARSTLSVLVLGETGVGKEIVATSIHERSPRASKPLVRLNCAALPETLLESELFGYEKGAFTGAAHAKPGLFEAANGGTLFLDEIGDMPLATQAKLLRVLESREVMRLGGLRPRAVDVRFVAATNVDLPAAMALGGFRRDLYYRLNGITVVVPPLRERASEIGPLARVFLASRARTASRLPPAITPAAMARLESFPWPGNVRQLRNVVDRALAICTGDVIDLEHLLLDAAAAPESHDTVVPPSGGGLMREDPRRERARLVAALRAADNHQGRAAEILGVSRRTLMNWLDVHRLPRPRKRALPTERRGAAPDG